MEQLAGRVALVTGAGSGLGRATSRLLAREGVVTGLLSRRAEPLRQLAAEIGKQHALPLPADVRDPAAVAAAVQQLVAAAGRLDILIYCAGVGRYGPVESYPLEAWRETLDTNVTGLFLCSQAALPHLRLRGGQIVAISSGAGRRGYANLAAYSASKFAVMGYMESLAEEAGPLGVRCTTLLPGSMLTEFGPSSREEKERLRAEGVGKKYLDPEALAAIILQVLRQPADVWTQQLNVWPF